MNKGTVFNHRYPHDEAIVIRANRLAAQMRESLEKAQCVNEIAKERDTLRELLSAVCDAWPDELEVRRDRARRYLRETGGAA